jgi:alkylhydroperoxidase family enzyme
MTSADDRLASTGTPRTQMLSTEEAGRVGDEAGMPRFIAQNGLFRTMLVHEPIATPMWGMVRALLRKGELDPHVRELVIMRVAWRTETAYEWAQHWRASELAGVGADKLEAVRDWRTSNLFSSAEAAALEATDDVLDSGTVGSSTWEACTRAFPSERDRVEMVSVIAMYQMVAVLLRSLQIPLDDDLDVWPPDGHEPGTEN